MDKTIPIQYRDTKQHSQAIEMHNSQSKMARREPMAPEQGASEFSVTHDDKRGRRDDGGDKLVLESSSSRLHSPRSSIKKDGEGGGAHRVGQDGGDGNKIQSTDFSSLKVPFPWRLWQLLEDSEKNGTQSIVAWLPEGDGIAISKPRAFTCMIMKAYFALTTYDSFVQELLRYGFTRTTIGEDNLKKVEVFRNPRYNRKEKLRSLAIRRRSLTRSSAERLTAAAKEQQKQRGGENDEIGSCCWPLSEDRDTQNNTFALASLLPISSQPQTQPGFGQNFQVATHDAVHPGEEMEEATMDRKVDNGPPSSSPITSSFFFPKNIEDFRGRGNDAGEDDFAFMIEAHKEFQHTQDGSQTTCFPSIIQYHDQLVDGEALFLSPDPISTQIRSSTSTQERPVSIMNQNHPSTGSTGSLPTRTRDHTESLRRAWHFLETSENDVSSLPQNMHDTWLTGTLPARPCDHFSRSTTFSQLSQISDNIETQHELEKTLDEDIMDSIFD